MSDSSRPRRLDETFEVECFRCRRDIELAVTAPPYRCPLCGALLTIEWGIRS